MMIEYHIESEYSKIDSSIILDLNEHVDSIIRWGWMRWNQISVPEFGYRSVPLVFFEDGQPVERLISLKDWPLEEENSDQLLALDSRIVDFFRTLKKKGVERPSIVG